LNIVSSSGGNRTHSIPGSKPRWSASCLPSHCLVCPKQESNLQSLGFKPSRSASWRIRALSMREPVVPDGLEPPLPGCEPGVVAAGPRDCLYRALLSGSRGTRTHNGVTAPVFETGSSSGRMTSVSQVAGAGIEPTSERSERPVLPLDDPASITKVRGAGLEPASPGSKPGSLPLADPQISKCPAGVEPTSPGWKPGTSAARPRAQSCGGRNRTCVGVINSHLPVPARVPPQNQSARLESNQHLRAPEARGLSVSPTRRGK
jgi:hypothetical protein